MNNSAVPALPRPVSLGALYRAGTSNPRYFLRRKALVAIAAGFVLNIICLLIAAIGYHHSNGTAIICGVAVGVYVISAVYQSLDLFSSLTFPTLVLLAVDGLGFLSFLALIIANAIVSTGPAAQIFMLNSIPWMVCCIVHGYIALQAFKQLLHDAIDDAIERRSLAVSPCQVCMQRHGATSAASSNCKEGEDDEDDRESAYLLRREDGEGSVRDLEARV